MRIPWITLSKTVDQIITASAWSTKENNNCCLDTEKEFIITALSLPHVRWESLLCELYRPFIYSLARWWGLPEIQVSVVVSSVRLRLNATVNSLCWCCCCCCWWWWFYSCTAENCCLGITLGNIKYWFRSKGRRKIKQVNDFWGIIFRSEWP